MSRRIGKCVRSVLMLVAPLAMMFAICVPASAVAAEGPQWVLTAVPMPTNMVPESPRSQAYSLNVDATGGTFHLIGESVQGHLHESPPIPYNASAGEVEEAARVLTEGYAGEIAVSGGPGGTAPYRLEFINGYGNRSLASLAITGARVDDSALTGGTHTATLTTAANGVSPGKLRVTATNVGGAATSGTVTLSDVLPSGVTATVVKAEDAFKDWEGFFGGASCNATPIPTCTFEKPVDPGDSFQMIITVAVAGGLSSSLPNEASVSGGGATGANVTRSLTVSETPAPFGVAAGSVFAAVSNPAAGAHANVTTSFMLNTSEPHLPSEKAKDVRFDMPTGLVGNTRQVPRCPMYKVLHETADPQHRCPADSMVGVAEVTLSIAGGNPQVGRFVAPVFNIIPAPGEPAAFAFDAFIVPARLDTYVLSNGNDGVRVTAPDISEGANVIGATVTIWGVPADHNGPGPDITFSSLLAGVPPFGGPGTGARVPELTNPQQCNEPSNGSMETDSWTHKGAFVVAEPFSMGTMSGCDQLRLDAKVSMLPDTLEAGAPAGYRFDLEVPQNETPDGVATPNIKDVTVKLPLGTVVNPSAAWGLKACSAAAFYGPDHPSQEPAREADCPRESQVGQVQIKTPALEEELEGQVFLGEPECDPCTPQDAEGGKMVKLYIQAKSEGEAGIVIKLEGRGHIDQNTGQITTTFENTPQLPFSEFQLKLAGGPRAVLANPRTCGQVTTNVDLTPWSSPFTADVTPSSSFDINENCFGAQFAPSFVAGSPNIQAGAYTPFTLSFGRSDSDEFLSGITQTMPPGLLGNLSAIPLCKEPQAAQGTCGTGSLIGHVQVLTGPGANPFLVSGGQVFLTEAYAGAPYGLSIVVPAVAGPYTLSGTTGKGTVVVRAKIAVDPLDAHLTVTSDPLPTMLDGIPLQLKAVNVTIDKPGFTFNPTSCAKKTIGGVLSSSEGMSASKTSSFQVTNCASLAFKPGFKVTTTGKTSRTNGAGLDVKLTYPSGSLGKYANVKSVKVDLPKQLPSRLTTLQKACTDTVFNQNPAACPAASKVGEATATTPIIPEALHGPAYFVSHGGAKFPELVIVLSGYGVTVQLHGETFISKAGITSSTFRQVPDVPIGGFELKLPQGPNSALAANGNLCTSVLKMPTAFTAQNGMVIKQTTPITATGCPKHKAKHKKGKK